MRTYEALTEDQHSVVLALVARRWATLAVQCAGASCDVSSAFPRHLYTPAERRRTVSKANAERVMLAGVIWKMTGREVPDVPTDEFIKTLGDEYEGRYRGKTTYDRHAGLKTQQHLAATVAAW